MTRSEEITSEISKKFFLTQYIYNDLYVKEGSNEKEFCDCLLEFSNAYICIQIKEKDSSSTLTPEEWFGKKVLKNATKQTRDTIAFLKDENNIIFSKNGEFCIDRTKSLVPVLVFLNPDIESYPRVKYSQHIKTPINIFSYEDFKIMLETVVLPYDIINYLVYRTAFNEADRKKLIIDNVDDNMTLLARPQDEQDYAQMFLARTYFSQLKLHDIHESEIELYNTIVSTLNESINFKRDEFVEGLLRTDYVGAARISRNWNKLVDAAQQSRFVAPFWISIDNRLYMFASHPNTMDENEYVYRINLCITYRKYKDQSINKIHLLTFKRENDDQYSVSLADASLDESFPYEELLDDAIKFFEGE